MKMSEINENEQTKKEYRDPYLGTPVPGKINLTKDESSDQNTSANTGTWRNPSDKQMNNNQWNNNYNNQQSNMNNGQWNNTYNGQQGNMNNVQWNNPNYRQPGNQNYGQPYNQNYNQNYNNPNNMYYGQPYNQNYQQPYNNYNNDTNKGLEIAGMIIGIVSIPLVFCYLLGLLTGILGLVLSLCSKPKNKMKECQVWQLQVLQQVP